MGASTQRLTDSLSFLAALLMYKIVYISYISQTKTERDDFGCKQSAE